MEIGLVEGTAAIKEDVLRVLNTELLARKGPDVLILDGLPIESYIEKGVLSDISDITTDEQYFTNITSAFSSEKGSFAVPARFQIPVLTGDKEMVDTLLSLPDIVKAAKKSPKLPDNWDGFPPSIAAINISSAQQESAKNFIRILLSEEVQKPEYHEGFPVNQSAFQFVQDRSKNRSLAKLS